MSENLPLPTRLWRMIFGPELDVEYHFDVHIKVDDAYKKTARQLEKDDTISLPNGVRLRIWSVDRFGIIKAKTYKVVKTDLRGYHPMEMYLVYPRVHGHLSDRAV